MERNYFQCEIKRGTSREVAWIPQKFAQIGRALRIKSDGQWQEGWEVTEVYSSMPETAVVAARDAHKYHRRNTDV